MSAGETVGYRAQPMLLFITRKYPPAIGGMEQLSYHLTTEIARRRPSRVLAWGGSQRLLPWFYLRAFVQALVFLGRQRVSLLHIGDPVLGPMGLLLGRLFGVPVVATVHGLDVTYPHPLYQLLIRAVLKRLDGIVAISAAAARECVARGVSPTCCHVVAVGVDPKMPLHVSREEARSWLEARLGLHLQEARVILTVGRLVPRKGVAHFVESVLPRVVERRPNTRYLVVGDGPDRRRIAALTKASGLAENVSLLGRLAQADVHAAYRACDLFLMPNIPVEGDIEGFGLVVLEAGAAQRWVVASDLEGIRDAIHPGQNGSLVPWDDPEAQAQAIVSLLDDDHERDRLGRQARQYVVRNFAWPGIADRYLDLFDRLGSLARAGR